MHRLARVFCAEPAEIDCLSRSPQSHRPIEAEGKHPRSQIFAPGRFAARNSTTRPAVRTARVRLAATAVNTNRSSREDIVVLGLVAVGATQHARFESVALPLMPALHRAAVHMTRDNNAASDLVQDTYLRAYRAFDQFRPGTNCRAWLFSIMYSVFNTAYRKAQRALTGSELMALEADYDRWLETGEGAAEPDVPPDLSQNLDPQVEQALNGLPEAFRQVVMLVDVGELSYEEAAAAIGCAVGTVRSRLFRARKYLFAALLTYAREEGYVTN
jgi:RNA polymerase sigma-70 factor (ECF subfamily)